MAREEFPEEVTPGEEEVTKQVKDKDTMGRENSLASEFKAIGGFLIPAYNISESKVMLYPQGGQS